MSDLSGARILIVEDEAIVAAMMAEFLADAGATVVGPAYSIPASLLLARTEAIDAAVLDINLRGEFVWPVAEALRDRNIPFVFATGYDDGPPADWPDVPVLGKPYTARTVMEALSALVRLRPVAVAGKE